MYETNFLEVVPKNNDRNEMSVTLLAPQFSYFLLGIREAFLRSQVTRTSAQI